MKGHPGAGEEIQGPGTKKECQRKRAQPCVLASRRGTSVSDGLFLPAYGLEMPATVLVPPFSTTNSHPHAVTRNPSSGAYRTRTPRAREASSAPRSRYGAGAWGEPVFAQPRARRPRSPKETAAALEPTAVRRERTISFGGSELQKLL